MKNYPFLKRESSSLVRVLDPHIDIKLVANQEVLVEYDAFEQLFELTDITRAIEDVSKTDPSFFGSNSASVDQIVLTPDFHKGSSIPVGTVIKTRNLLLPQAPGNDICCGMRLLTTDIPSSTLEGKWTQIIKSLRSLFFEGKRNIPMSPRQREAVLRYGLPGLNDTRKGLWRKCLMHTRLLNL